MPTDDRDWIREGAKVALYNPGIGGSTVRFTTIARLTKTQIVLDGDIRYRRDDLSRVGGNYKWQWRSREDGKRMGFFGTFTEVNGPSKLVHEEYYDPGDIGGAMPAGDPCIVSLELSEQNGVTTLVCNMKFASKEARDGAVSTGMTDGMEYSYARLADMFKAAA